MQTISLTDRQKETLRHFAPLGVRVEVARPGNKTLILKIEVTGGAEAILIRMPKSQHKQFYGLARAVEEFLASLTRCRALVPCFPPVESAKYGAATVPSPCEGRNRRSGYRSKPLPPTPAVIYLGPPRATEDQLAPFEYANRKLARLGAHERTAALNAMANLMDAALNYLIGDAEKLAFTTAQGFFTRTIGELKGEKHVPHWPNFGDWSPGLPSEAEQGQRLGDLLKRCLNVEAQPAGPQIVIGDWRYNWRQWPGGDAIQIEREHPNGRSWLKGRIAFEQRDSQEVVADLEKMFEAEAAKLATCVDRTSRQRR
jgi:hypothetical protein